MMHSVHMGHFSLSQTLSQTEIEAMRIDGDLSQTNDMWDEIQTWRTRSFEILKEERHPLVLTGISAAWAFGAATEPFIHFASTVTSQRIRDPHNANVKIEERTLDSVEVWMYKHTGVTSPLRTITDVLKMKDITEHVWMSISSAVMELHSITAGDVITNIESMNYVPHKQLALLRARQLNN